MELFAKFATCITVVSFISFAGNSQILKSLGNHVKQKVNQRIGQKADEAIDKGLDKAEKAGKNAGKPKDSTINPGNNSDDNAVVNVNADAVDNQEAIAGKPAGQISSKFDFIPGDKVIAYDDFSNDATGDFPVTWNTNSSGEVVTSSAYMGRWLMVRKQGRYIPEYIKSLPDNFTFEYDVICNDQFNFYSPVLSLFFLSGSNNKNVFGQSFIALEKRSGVKIGVHPMNSGSNAGRAYIENFEDGEGVINNQINTAQFNSLARKTKLHVSVWRQKQRIRVYLNEEKIFDLPRAFPAGKIYSTVLFEIFGEMNNDNDAYLISNITLAAGAPDTRTKLLTEGKFVTRGILFDVNSDKIKPASYGVLKDIAGVLSENASIKVKIVGHTDADGSDDDNLELSKRRAASVKSSLVEDFGINASRLETDGKGESQLLDMNTTAEAKANNRRVEFIRL